MSRSIWVINKAGWEYDDSNYYRSGGVGPYQAYTDKEIAESFMRDLEVKELRDIGNRLDDFIRADYFRSDETSDIEELCNILDISYNGHDISFNKSIQKYSDDELLKIAYSFFLNFYELVEVELVA